MAIEFQYTCPSCLTIYQTEDEIKFCSECGALVESFSGQGPANSKCRSAPSKRVLLVDDSLLSRKKMGAILWALHCEVHEAKNGEEGLREAQSLNPDLIVLDVQMPHRGGGGVRFSSLPRSSNSSQSAAKRRAPRSRALPLSVCASRRKSELWPPCSARRIPSNCARPSSAKISTISAMDSPAASSDLRSSRAAASNTGSISSLASAPSPRAKLSSAHAVSPAGRPASTRSMAAKSTALRTGLAT